jgi:hypothetical protein
VVEGELENDGTVSGTVTTSELLPRRLRRPRKQERGQGDAARLRTARDRERE